MPKKHKRIDLIVQKRGNIIIKLNYLRNMGIHETMALDRAIWKASNLISDRLSGND